MEKGLLLLLILVNNHLNLSPSLAVTFKHRDVISENGTRFVQRVEIDPVDQVEVFHVPAHNHLLEIKELYDFKTGLVLRCQPARKACFLAEFDRKNYEKPTKLERNLQHFERSHHSPQREERRETVVTESLVVVDSKPVHAGSLLTPRMRNLLGNYKLFREIKLPKRATVITDTGMEMVAPKRTKRAVCTPKCRFNADPVTKYVRTPGSGWWGSWWGRSCERTRHCVNGRCTWKHLTHNTMYMCCCCPEHTTSQECYKAWGKCTYHRYYG